MNDRNEHVNGVKEAIETIIGTGLSLKKKKKTTSDTDMEMFIYIITLLEQIESRSTLLNADFSLDLTNYDSSYYEIIDKLLELQYGKPATDLIHFYLYDRINMDGSINDLINEHGEIVPLSNATDLWYMVKEIHEKIKKIKNKK